MGVEDLMASEGRIYRQSVRDREPQWRGAWRRRFRWRHLRFERGRWCYIVHPVEGGRDIMWWEWEA